MRCNSKKQHNFCVFFKLKKKMIVFSCCSERIKLKWLIVSFYIGFSPYRSPGFPGGGYPGLYSNPFASGLPSSLLASQLASSSNPFSSQGSSQFSSSSFGASSGKI